MGKVQRNQNWTFMIISDHFKLLCWEKNEEKNGKIKIVHSQLFWTTLEGKDQKKYEMTKIGHSESFCTTLVGKDWKICGATKIGCSE